MSKSASLPRIRSKARPASQRPRLVERELERAQLRIRTIDALYAICLLVGGILTYLLIIIALDYSLHLNDGTRQLLWCIAGVGGLVFVGWRMIYPLIQHINPYYTARMIERATPGSKNGIINWLDLRDEQNNPVIRDALSRRAVHELDSANMEVAIPTKKPIRTVLVIGGMVLALITVALFLPDQLGSLFQRALFPFKPAIIPTHTRLEVISPIAEPVPEVDVDTLPIKEVQVERGQPVEFRVSTHGKLPTEVVMESQTAGDKQPVIKPLRQDKKDDNTLPWRVALSSSDIPVDGFVFWFRANDGLTRKFKLVVTSRTPPSVSDLDVKLTYPAYTKRRATTQGLGPIKAIEGTKVDILVTADRPAASGELEVMEEQLTGDGSIVSIRKQSIRLVRPEGNVDDNKLSLAEPLMLKPEYVSKDDKRQKFFYQLTLVSPENLSGTSPKYPLDVLTNLAPTVVINKVKQVAFDKKQEEIEVEANAVVPFEGVAHDDIAMGQVSFKLRTSDGRDLFFVGNPPMEKNLQKATGFAPPPVQFLLTLDMTKLTFDDNPATAKAIQLKPGTVIEAIVEGRDTTEPTAYTGTSQLIKLKLKGDASQEERKNQEKQAGEKQEQHDQQKKDKEQQQGENDKKEEGDKSNEKGDKSNEKGDKSNEKGDKSNEKGDKSNEKGDKANEKGDKSNEKGDKSNEKGDKSNEKGDKSNEKGDKSNEKGDKSNEKGDKSNEKGDKANEKGDKSNEKGDKANEKGDKSNEKGDKANEKGDKQPDKNDQPPGKDQGQAGGGAGKDPNDKGDLSKILEQLAKDKDKKTPEKTNFTAKPAESKDDKKAQALDDEAARKRDLALDTLADKLRRGDIDRKLDDKLKELKLTKEDALKLVQNSKVDRRKGTGTQADQGPNKSMTTMRRNTELNVDPANDPPDELSSSYRTFTERRNQQPRPQGQPK